MPKRPQTDEPEVAARPRERSWSTKLAWGVLVGGGTLVLLRMAFATVVKVHGDGMAPALLDGDHVLLLRGAWSVDRGDVVVYAAEVNVVRARHLVPRSLAPPPLTPADETVLADIAGAEQRRPEQEVVVTFEPEDAS